MWDDVWGGSGGRSGGGMGGGVDRAGSNLTGLGERNGQGHGQQQQDQPQEQQQWPGQTQLQGPGHQPRHQARQQVAQPSRRKRLKKVVSQGQLCYSPHPAFTSPAIAQWGTPTTTTSTSTSTSTSSGSGSSSSSGYGRLSGSGSGSKGTTPVLSGRRGAFSFLLSLADRHGRPQSQTQAQAQTQGHGLMQGRLQRNDDTVTVHCEFRVRGEPYWYSVQCTVSRGVCREVSLSCSQAASLVGTWYPFVFATTVFSPLITCPLHPRPAAPHLRAYRRRPPLHPRPRPPHPHAPTHRLPWLLRLHGPGDAQLPGARPPVAVSGAACVRAARSTAGVVRGVCGRGGEGWGWEEWRWGSGGWYEQ